MVDHFDEQLSAEERAVLAELNTPARIQAYLDATPYAAESRNRCPLTVLRDRRAHCLDGGLFAALALRRLGYPPLIVDLLPEPGTDDDHILAIYRQNDGIGAVAKSNFTGLRSREPVYRTLRELAMSYFEVYFNVDGVRTLRAYTRPLNLAPFDRLGWTWSDEGADAIEQHLYKLRPIPLITPEQAAALGPLDSLTYRAGTLESDPAGMYQPAKG
jgi:hypothetical protein